jgi:hypothetical protein
MKRCPTCNRTFHDEFSFCLVDGSILSAPYDLQETLVLQTPLPTNRERDSTLIDEIVAPSFRRRTGGLYFEFWQGFKEYCRVKGTTLNLDKQSDRFYYAISAGRGDILLSLGASLKKKRLGCELYLRGAKAKRSFRLLEQDRQVIEERTGSLDWQELPDKQDCRIVKYRWDFNITHKSRWDDAYGWLKTEGELLYNTFFPLIKGLPR